LINVAVGCVDNHHWFSPQRVVYAKSRPVWDMTATNIPNFDKMPQ
jgi:hypothetical protein